MIKVRYDDQHNTVILEFEGDVDAAQTERIFSDFEKVLPKPGKGFTLLADFSSVQSMELPVKHNIEKAMELFSARGVTEIIRVLPEQVTGCSRNLSGGSGRH